MATYGFSQGDAGRIGRAVRKVERNDFAVRLGGPNDQKATPGVRLLMGKHSGSSWPQDTTAVITVYNGTAEGSIRSAGTVIAYNHYIEFGEDTVCSSRWVALGHNGFMWLPVDSNSECGTCIPEIGGVDFRIFPGYERTTEQVLGHDAAGCIKWFDTTTCATAT